MEPFRSKCSAYEQTVGRYETKLKASRSQVDRALGEWRSKTVLPDLATRKDKLRTLKTEIDRIPEKRRKDLEALESQRRQLQMSRHLERYRVIDATIEGVGSGRKLTLESYGIQTADDVTASNLAAVPGFGPKLTRNILAWRLSAEARFVFDPSKGVDPTAIAAVEQAILALKSRLVGQAEAQANELLRDLMKIMNVRTSLRTRIAASQQDLAQATADYQHVHAALKVLHSAQKP